MRKEDKWWGRTQSSSVTQAYFASRCDLCQWGTLEDPSALLSGYHEGLRDGKAECGGADSGGGSVPGGGAAEIKR